jgi:hypothetical protein
VKRHRASLESILKCPAVSGAGEQREHGRVLVPAVPGTGAQRAERGRLRGVRQPQERRAARALRGQTAGRQGRAAALGRRQRLRGQPQKRANRSGETQPGQQGVPEGRLQHRPAALHAQPAACSGSRLAFLLLTLNFRNLENHSYKNNVIFFLHLIFFRLISFE